MVNTFLAFYVEIINVDTDCATLQVVLCIKVSASDVTAI